MSITLNSLLRHSGSLVLLAVFTAGLSGCVTPNNSCGNLERDWNNLHFPKTRYCSVPAFLPFADYYETANKSVCKVHDNNSGVRATMTQSEADKRFLCDYMKHSELPVWLRTITGHASYLLLRLGAADEAAPDTEASRAPLVSSDNNPVGKLDGKPVHVLQP